MKDSTLGIVDSTPRRVFGVRVDYSIAIVCLVKVRVRLGYGFVVVINLIISSEFLRRSPVDIPWKWRVRYKFGLDRSK